MSLEFWILVVAIMLGICVAGLYIAVRRRKRKKNFNPNEIYPLW